MNLTQILLPLRDNTSKVFDRSYFDGVTANLPKRFGGVTYSRAPAEERWESRGSTNHDGFFCWMMISVATWWAEFRKQFEEAFRQQEIVVRAQHIARL